MKKRTKSVIKIVSIILLIAIISLTVIILTEKPTFADAGFSAGHGGGGHSSHSSHSSRGGGSGSDIFGGIIAVIYIITMYTILILNKNKNKKDMNRIKVLFRNSVSDQKLNSIIPNFDRQKFLNEAFDIYKAVEIAWMNFSLEDVKDKITDELYNMYESQLATLQVKGEKNMMENINIEASVVSDIVEQNGIVTVTVLSQITQNDYIINESTGKVLRGNKKVPMHMTYELKYRMSIDENAKIENCPNCGAKLENMNGATTCTYCNSKIVTDNTKWVITQKKALLQR